MNNHLIQVSHNTIINVANITSVKFYPAHEGLEHRFPDALEIYTNDSKIIVLNGEKAAKVYDYLRGLSTPVYTEQEGKPNE